MFSISILDVRSVKADAADIEVHISRTNHGSIGKRQPHNDYLAPNPGPARVGDWIFSKIVQIPILLTHGKDRGYREESEGI
jgi:hypothetical protein